MAAHSGTERTGRRSPRAARASATSSPVRRVLYMAADKPQFSGLSAGSRVSCSPRVTVTAQPLHHPSILLLSINAHIIAPSSSCLPSSCSASSTLISLPSMKAAFCLSLAPLLAAASPVLHVGTIHNDVAPILSSMNAKEIPDSYIVVFKQHVKHADALAHHSWVQDLHLSSQDSKMELKKRSQFPITTEIFEGLKHTYNVAGGLLGYSGHFDEHVIEQVRRHPDVSRSLCGVFAFILHKLSAYSVVCTTCWYLHSARVLHLLTPQWLIAPFPPAATHLRVSTALREAEARVVCHVRALLTRVGTGRLHREGLGGTHHDG